MTLQKLHKISFKNNIIQQLRTWILLNWSQFCECLMTTERVYQNLCICLRDTLPLRPHWSLINDGTVCNPQGLFDHLSGQKPIGATKVFQLFICIYSLQEFRNYFHFIRELSKLHLYLSEDLQIWYWMRLVFKGTCVLPSLQKKTDGFQKYSYYFKRYIFDTGSTEPDVVFTPHIYTAAREMKILHCWTVNFLRTFTSRIQLEGEPVFIVFCVYTEDI